MTVHAREIIMVMSVTIIHRIDCCIERFQNAYVVLFDADGNYHFCGDGLSGVLTPTDRETTFDCGLAFPARFIRIVLTGNDVILQVNELTVSLG